MSMDFLPLILIFLLAIYNGGKHLTSDRTKNVPWHILSALRRSLATSSLNAAVRILPEAFLYNRKCNFLLYQ